MGQFAQMPLPQQAGRPVALVDERAVGMGMS
jgi:hypothetical protein